MSIWTRSRRHSRQREGFRSGARRNPAAGAAFAAGLLADHGKLPAGFVPGAEPDEDYRPRHAAGNPRGGTGTAVMTPAAEPEDPDGEGWTPEELAGLAGADSHPYPETDPREDFARVLSSTETPTMAELQRLLEGLRTWEPESPDEAPGCERPGPRRLDFTAPVEALRAPGGADLVSFHAQEKAIVARLDGMPERCVTPSGRPVLMLGVWPASNGASFGIGGMSDAWLDALITAANEERDSRRAAAETPRVPTFTPRDTTAADGATGTADAPALGWPAGGDL